MPDLLDYSEFCEELKEVTTPKIFEKRKFHPEGLFSEQIFGPLNNYTCQCGTYYGISKSGGTCGFCGVDIVPARTRRERFAKITLPIKVVNPLFYDLVVNLAGSKIRDLLDKLIKDETSILCKDNDDIVLIYDQESKDNYNESYEGLNAIYELVKHLAEKGVSENIPEWNKIYNNLDKLLINDIIVLPPELRPTSMKANVNELDEINRYYTHILMKKQVVEKTIVDVTRDKKLFYQYFRQLQKNVHDLYNQILTKLSKKEGLIRGNILGKRIDFSGRGVISPDPTIDIDTCVVPYIMFLELFKLEIAKRLIELEKFKLLNNAIDFIEDCIKREDHILYNICKEVNQGKTCLLNRQPSLHRLSMLGFYMDISFDKVIKIHPLICPPTNADFDGDCFDGRTFLKVDDKLIETKMDDILNLNLFNYKNEKVKDDGTYIKKYKPNEKIQVKSINPEDGETGWKNVSEFSVHENLEMFEIKDPKERFKTFWSSRDHSLLIFDENDEQIKKISPIDLKNDPKGKYVIQNKKGDESHDQTRTKRNDVKGF